MFENFPRRIGRAFRPDAAHARRKARNRGIEVDVRGAALQEIQNVVANRIRFLHSYSLRRKHSLVDPRAVLIEQQQGRFRRTAR
jgi:hypothetical protein